MISEEFTRREKKVIITELIKEKDTHNKCIFLRGKRTLMNLSELVLMKAQQTLTGGDEGLCLGSGHPHDRGGGRGNALGLPGHL